MQNYRICLSVFHPRGVGSMDRQRDSSTGLLPAFAAAGEMSSTDRIAGSPTSSRFSFEKSAIRTAVSGKLWLVSVIKALAARIPVITTAELPVITTMTVVF